METETLLRFLIPVVFCCFLIGIVVGGNIEQDKASYCSTCNKIYFDESNRCDECGTEYIKYEGEKK